MKKATQSLILLLILSFGACNNNQPEQEPQPQKQKNFMELACSLSGLDQNAASTLLTTEGYSLNEEKESYKQYVKDIYKITIGFDNSIVYFVDGRGYPVSNISNLLIDWLNTADENGYSQLMVNHVNYSNSSNKDYESTTALKNAIQGAKDSELDYVEVVLRNTTTYAGLGIMFERYNDAFEAWIQLQGY